MNRRTILQVVGFGSAIGLGGCTTVGTDKAVSGTHRHLRSTSVWNGVPKTIQQTVFVPDVVVNSGHIDVLTTVVLDLPDESDRRPEESTVSLAVDSTADEWTKEWEDDTRLSGTLTAEMGEGDTVSITSQTTFESGGSVQTTRYEEIHYAE